MQRKISNHLASGLVVLSVLVLIICGQAGAQTTTSSIGGVVTDDRGPIPGAQVVAQNTENGFKYQTTADNDGAYRLNGLPPGSYEMGVSSEAYKEQKLTVRLLLGQSATANFRLTLDQVFLANVTVIGKAIPVLQEMRTPEVATNVTAEQIAFLPQSSRNFMNFASLAPGVNVVTKDNDNDPNHQGGFRSGGQDGRQVNVFIDGLSYKNDVLKGGAFMQDSSRGNPFPQSAVQEFRVLTSNYKAEYEKAAAAIITAVTKTGGNEWKGDAFLQYQGKSMVAQEKFSADRGDLKPDYKDVQGGFGIGGPISDRLHLFGSYEQDQEDRFNSIFRGSDFSKAPASVQSQLSTYPTGNVAAPFRSKLFFGKVSFQPAVSQSLDISANVRDEYERRGFGGQRVFEGAEDFRVKTAALVAKHQTVFGNAINEAFATYQKLQWNPTALTPNNPHENYFGILDVGGKDSSQDYKQDRIGLRDDVSYVTNWMGQHVLKAGVGLNSMKYNVENRLNGNPTFNFRSDEQWLYPFEAFYGFGDPTVKINNRQFGLFAQDDWNITSQLQLNVGLRWDYESNMLNNNYRTPAALVTALKNAQMTDSGVTYKLTDVLDLSRYTTDGSQRTPYKGMIQPRLGFSFDVLNNGKTMVFGGFGKYYDRVNLVDIYEEEHKLTWKTYHFCFSADGTPRPGCGVAPLMWNNSYLSKSGLDALIASGQAPGPEVWLLANDTKPPYTNQWTLGVRQALGQWVGSLSYNNVRGYNGLTWFFGDRRAGSTSQWGDNIPVAGYGRVLTSSTARKTWYNGAYLTLDKPFTMESNWGVNFAYTWSKSEQYGRENQLEGTSFGFDYITPDNFTKVPGNYDERHHVVLSGIVGLPFGVRASSILTLGSALPFTIYDASAGWDHFVNRWNAGRQPSQTFLLGKWAYRSVDVRLSKDFALASHYRVGLEASGLNVFNYNNTGCFGWSEGFIDVGGKKDPKFGLGSCQINPRRVQVGMNLSF
jgi:outer membrane receptor for ferrienterochelin and colicin